MCNVVIILHLKKRRAPVDCRFGTTGAKVVPKIKKKSKMEKMKEMKKEKSNFASFLASYKEAKKEMCTYEQVRVQCLNIINLANLKGSPFEFSQNFAKAVLAKDCPEDLKKTRSGKYCVYYCLLYIRRQFLKDYSERKKTK